MVLVFHGGRPDRAGLARLGAAGGGGMDFSVTDAVGEDGAAEILAMGLTFDVRGLADTAAVPFDPGGPLLGLAAPPAGEAITIVPAPNVRSNPLMLPVVRMLAGIAARIGSAGAAALRWEPAGLWLDPAGFARTVDAWLAGGAFPAPGLVSFERAGDALRTRGLAALTGQELVLRTEPPEGETRAARAVRLIHLMAGSNPIDRERIVRLPGGSHAVLRPIADGRYVEAE